MLTVKLSVGFDCGFCICCSFVKVLAVDFVYVSGLLFGVSFCFVLEHRTVNLETVSCFSCVSQSKLKAKEDRVAY